MGPRRNNDMMCLIVRLKVLIPNNLVMSARLTMELRITWGGLKLEPLKFIVYVGDSEVEILIPDKLVMNARLTMGLRIRLS